MRVSKSARKGFRKLSLIGIAAGTIVSIAVAAVGFPFTEDFSTADLKGAATTADWDTGTGILGLGLATALSAPSVTRVPMGGLGDVTGTTRDIALGDLDGDGDLDAVVGNEGVDLFLGAGPAGAVNQVYENNAGVFDIAPIDLGTSSEATRGIAIGDIDRDGSLDVVAGNFQGFGVYYLNDGSPNLNSPNFSAGTVFTNQSRATWKVALADVDGDGDLDYIEGNDSGDNSLYVNLLMETGTFSFDTETRITTDNFSTRSMVLGDINNDGDLDLIAGDQGTGNHLYYWDAGQFKAGAVVHANSNKTFAVALADLDGDGLIDLVEGNADLATQVYLNLGGGSFALPTPVADSNPLHTTVGLILRDFDRDGDIDIIEGNNGDWDDDGDGDAVTPRVPQPVRLFLNNGNGTFANGLDDAPPLKQKTYAMAAGDIDSDGRLDFVTANSSNAESPLPALAGNAVYFNDGTPGGGLIRQLDGFAVSSADIDGGGAAIPTARLTVAKVQQAVQATTNFYLSNNNGTKFVRVDPGVPVSFPDPTGTELMWKVEMLTSSPNAAQLAQIDQVDIAANNAPAFNNVGDINAIEGQALAPTFLNLYFSDGDSDALSYAVSGLPAGTGLQFDTVTSQLSGVLTNADAQASPITLAASAYDGAELGSGNIQLNVLNAVNDPPVAGDDGPLAVDEGGTLNGATVLGNDTDPENGTLTAVLATGPANAASFILNADGTFVYTHDGSETATDSFTYRAADDGVPSSQSNEATVSIAVTLVNDAPVITLNGSAAVAFTVGGTYTDAGAAALDEEDGAIAVVVGGDTVNVNAAGSYTITYDATDSGGNPAVQVTRLVTVNALPPPPPPPPKRGGGMFGLWEIMGLMFAGLVSYRRRRSIKAKV